MQYKIVESRIFPGEWRVEAIDHGSDGECYSVIFSGPKSEERAIEYHAWISANGRAQGGVDEQAKITH